MDLFKLTTKGNLYELEKRDFTEYWDDFNDLYQDINEQKGYFIKFYQIII